jgi:RNA polymerase sigma-70 factor (ECF subfamily)
VSPFDSKALETAAALWPDVQVDERLFREYVQARVASPARGKEGDASHTPEQIASLYLCFACVQGSEAACAAFQQKYLGVIRGSIARIFPNRPWIDDVASRFLGQLLVGKEPRLTRYSGRGDLAAWLKVVATRAAIDAKRTHPDQDEEPLSSSVEAAMSLSPESLIFCRTHAHGILDALTRAISSLDKKQRNILRLNYTDGLSIDEIGALYGVHRATVARWLQHARTSVESQVLEDLRTQRGIDPTDIGSLIHGAGPYLEDTLRKLLGDSKVAGDESFEELAPTD